jgi:DNA repair ATPase RecN
MVDDKSRNQDLQTTLETLLKQNPEIKSLLGDYENKCLDIDSEFDRVSNTLKQSLASLKEIKEAIQKSPTLEALQTNINTLQAQVEDLRSKYSLSEEEMKQYQETQIELKKFKQKIEASNNQVKLLDSNNVRDLTLEGILGNGIIEVEDRFKIEIEECVQNFNQIMKDKLNEIKVTLTNESKQYNSDLEALQTNIAPIQSRINQLPALKEYEESLAKEKSKLETLQKYIEDKNNSEIKVQDLYNQLVGTIDSRCEAITILNQSISETLQIANIAIKVDPRLNENRRLQQLLRTQIAFKTNKDIRDIVNSEDNIRDDVNFKEHLEIIFEKIKSGTIESKGGFDVYETFTDILKHSISKNMDVLFEDDYLSKMSPGKKSIVLLQLLVDFDNSEHPLILDQPEDDLDNESVFVYLVQYLKKKKKQRQIIVVTHDPNVVVAGDSECVIIANREDNKQVFTYTQGALENSEIKDSICRILDGGEIAFQKRESLYKTLPKHC